MAVTTISELTPFTPSNNLILPVVDPTQGPGLKNGSVTVEALTGFVSTAASTAAAASAATAISAALAGGTIAPATDGIVPVSALSIPSLYSALVGTTPGTLGDGAVLAGAVATANTASTNASNALTSASSALTAATAAQTTANAAQPGVAANSGKLLGAPSTLGGTLAAISLAASLLLSSGTLGVAFGTSATTAAAGNDSRIVGAEQVANKGAASGYAPLDSTAKVPLANLPASVVGANHYISTWNASTNTPTITSGTAPGGGAPIGSYYIVSVAGTPTIDGVSVWNAGDWILWDGTKWDKLDGQANPVSSVAGRQGAVSLAYTDISGLGAAAVLNVGTGLANTSGSLTVTYGTAVNQALQGSLFGAANGVAALDGNTSLSANTVIATGAAAGTALGLGDHFANLALFNCAALTGSLATNQANLALITSDPLTTSARPSGPETNTGFGIGTPALTGGGSSNIQNTYFGYGAGNGAGTQGNNTFFGYAAGAIGNSVGQDTAVGSYALRHGGGGFNTCIGSNAGATLSGTNAIQNTIVGHGSMGGLDTGGYVASTASACATLGTWAFQGNTGAANSVGIGISCAPYYNNLNNSVMIGYQIGYGAITDVGSSVVIGAYCLNQAIGGTSYPVTNSVIIGEACATYFNGSALNTVGQNSCHNLGSPGTATAGGNRVNIFGYQGLYSATGATLDNDIAGFGHHVFYSVNGAKNITAIGSYAGLSLTTGSYNLFAGDYSGQYVLTGSRNVFLGSSSNPLSGLDPSDVIAIGYNTAPKASGQIWFGTSSQTDLVIGGLGNGLTTGIARACSTYTAFGVGAAASQSSLNGFVAVGQYAGQLATTAYNTTIVGAASGSSFLASNGNIVIGDHAASAGATFVGTISGTTLTVSSRLNTANSIVAGPLYIGGSVLANILPYGTNSTTGSGGTGTYALDTSLTYSTNTQMAGADYSDTITIGSGINPTQSHQIRIGSSTITNFNVGAGLVLVTSTAATVGPLTFTYASGVATLTQSLAVTGGFVGNATGAASAAGNIGEFQTVSVSNVSPVTITTSATAQNIKSLPLTAGTWLVTANIVYSPSAAPTAIHAWLSTSSTATTPTGTANGTWTRLGLSFTSGQQQAITAGALVVYITPAMVTALTNNVYIAGQVTFASGSVTAVATINATRIC